MATAISVSGDRRYTDAIKILATQNGKSVAEFVRSALDEKHGKEIQTIMDSFFATSDVQKHHSINRDNGGVQ